MIEKPYCVFSVVLQLGHTLESAFKMEGGLERYLAEMRKDYVWGDGIMLEAATQVYNRSINVHYPSGHTVSIGCITDNVPFHVGYVNDNHYVSLMKLDQNAINNELVHKMYKVQSHHTTDTIRQSSDMQTCMPTNCTVTELKSSKEIKIAMPSNDVNNYRRTSPYGLHTYNDCFEHECASDVDPIVVVQENILVTQVSGRSNSAETLSCQLEGAGTDKNIKNRIQNKTSQM